MNGLEVPITIGLALDEQIVENVPVDKHDRLMFIIFITFIIYYFA
jgi:5-formyltetrahydrofolate cyclo-ligase